MVSIVLSLFSALKSRRPSLLWRLFEAKFHPFKTKLTPSTFSGFNHHHVAIHHPSLIFFFPSPSLITYSYSFNHKNKYISLSNDFEELNFSLSSWFLAVGVDHHLIMYCFILFLFYFLF